MEISDLRWLLKVPYRGGLVLDEIEVDFERVRVILEKIQKASCIDFQDYRVISNIIAIFIVKSLKMYM